MNPRPYILAETNWKTVKATDYQLALLPWGATEAHNYHLPYATDNYEAFAVAAASAKLAWKRGTKVIVLPTIPFGVNTGQMDIKLCMNMNPSTQYAVLKDVVEVLGRHRINKLVIINSHGGNHFKQMIRELSVTYPGVFVCNVDWYKIGDANEYFAEPGDHAGEMETSVMMHIEPELVLPLQEAGPGSAKSFKLKGFKQGWASTQRQWTKVTEDTGVGNPARASAEKGKAYLEFVCREIGDFLVELEKTEIDDLYE